MSTLPEACDCVVVGVGIAGVCAAINIQKSGARVAIVDPSSPGSGASSGNAGIIVNTGLTPVFAGLSPRILFDMLRDPASPLNLRWSRALGLAPWFLRMLRHAGLAEVERITSALASLSLPGAAHYDQLIQEAGLADLVHANGSLALYRDAESRDAAWDGTLAHVRSLGVTMHKLDRDAIAALAPTVSDGYSDGIHSPDYRHSSDPQGLVARLCDLFTARGGALVEGSAGRVEIEDGRVTGLTVGSRGAGLNTIKARQVVIAAGTASAAFARQVGEPVPHQAVGGYHAMLRDPGLDLRTPLLPTDFRFAITPMGRTIRLAGVYEFGGEGLGFQRRLIDDMLAHAAKVLPGVRTDDVTTWRGFRSYLPDGLPIIGSSARCDGLFYLFGLSSAGMINGATAGRALAGSIAGTPPEIDLEPFSIRRFLRS